MMKTIAIKMDNRKNKGQQKLEILKMMMIKMKTMTIINQKELEDKMRIQIEKKDMIWV